MAHHFIDTPRTDAADRTRFDTTIGDVSFGVAEPSFVPLDGRDDLFKVVRSTSGATTLTTPRIPLTSKRNVPQSRQEFTPLLRSATKNAMRVRGIEDKENNYGKLRTPAALRPGFRLSSPIIPEASEFGSSGLHSNDNDGDKTPMAPGIESSSIDISTPQALPKGDLGMDGGNMLTLKEQENKLEQIDKENFGLKLKIHYLEEALGKTGSEYQQQMTRDHVELQAGKIVMERELKKYKKMLVDAETNLELYRKQLLEYAEKIKRKHEDEIASEELSRVQQLADAREDEIQRLKGQIESESRGDNEEIEKLRDELDVLETELEGKERALEQKDEELDELHTKVKAAASDLDVELDERDRRIEAQADELDQLRDQVAKLERERDEREDALQVKLDAAAEEHAAELDDLCKQLDLAQRDKREQLRNFELRLQTYDREKRAELEATQRKLESLEKEKTSEIESLELRLKLAESNGDNQSQLARQAAIDAQERLKMVTQEKEEEIESLRSQINAFEGIQDELDTCQKQLRDYAEDVKHRHEEESRKEEIISQLRLTIQDREKEFDAVKCTAEERHKQLEQLREELSTTRTDLEDEIAVLETEIASLQDNLKLKTDALTDAETKLAMTDNDDCINLDRPTPKTKHSEELGALNDMLKQSALECESLRLELAQKQKIAAADIAVLGKELGVKERQVTDLEETSRRHVSAQAKMQDTRVEVGRLQTLLAETEKRHAKEIRGLAKTLTFLRAKSDREEKFREGLGWQKRWFLLMVDMYGRCNRMDLKLLEEIGITPDPQVRERAKRPRLRTVVWALVFCERARKAAEVWREKMKVQDALARKVEVMRGRQVEGKRVTMQVYR